MLMMIVVSSDDINDYCGEDDDDDDDNYDDHDDHDDDDYQNYYLIAQIKDSTNNGMLSILA